MDKIYGSILTLIAGLFFLLGGLICKRFKNKDSLNVFSVSLAFVIIIALIVSDLFPEILELLEEYKLSSKIILIILFTGLGILLLKILDFFIPDHHHEHHENEENLSEHKSHVKHIGTITVISLILHNILEGFAIFGMSLNSLKLGIMICISVALHNIPLGTHIFGSLDFKKNRVLITFLTLSSFLGGLIFLIVGDISNLVLAVITCITLGMLLYIGLLELLPEMLTHFKEKETKLGIMVGLILLIISFLV